MRTRLVRIGNSRGVRIPKPLIEQAGLGEAVELRVTEGSIIVSRSERPRHGWAEAAVQLAARGEDELLDVPTLTRFDEEEWKW
jgi:antitoxin MazE